MKRMDDVPNNEGRSRNEIVLHGLNAVAGLVHGREIVLGFRTRTHRSQYDVRGLSLNVVQGSNKFESNGIFVMSQTDSNIYTDVGVKNLSFTSDITAVYDTHELGPIVMVVSMTSPEDGQSLQVIQYRDITFEEVAGRLNAGQRIPGDKFVREENIEIVGGKRVPGRSNSSDGKEEIFPYKMGEDIPEKLTSILKSINEPFRQAVSAQVQTIE